MPVAKPRTMSLRTVSAPRIPTPALPEQSTLWRRVPVTVAVQVPGPMIEKPPRSIVTPCALAVMPFAPPVTTRLLVSR